MAQWVEMAFPELPSQLVAVLGLTPKTFFLAVVAYLLGMC